MEGGTGIEPGYAGISGIQRKPARGLAWKEHRTHLPAWHAQAASRSLRPLALELMIPIFVPMPAAGGRRRIVR
jgi:hypothetical protein